MAELKRNTEVDLHFSFYTIIKHHLILKLPASGHKSTGPTLAKKSDLSNMVNTYNIFSACLIFVFGKNALKKRFKIAKTG